MSSAQNDFETICLVVLREPVFCCINFSFPSAGRTMYVIPFSMGPVGSALSKYGVQV